MRGLLWSVTLLRVALIPVFVWLGLRAQVASGVGDDRLSWMAVAVLVVMGLSDVVDGWMARRWNLATLVGATADAVADKLVQVSLVAFFVLSVGPAFRPIPLWFLFVIFGRDLMLLVGVSVLRLRYGPLVVVHRWHGRAASALVHLVLLWAALRLPATPMIVLMVATGVLSVYSATLYALNGAAQGRAAARL